MLEFICGLLVGKIFLSPTNIEIKEIKKMKPKQKEEFLKKLNAELRSISPSGSCSPTMLTNYNK